MMTTALSWCVSLRAGNVVSMLMNSDLATSDDRQPLSVIKHHMDYMCCCSQKEISSCDFLAP